MTRPCVCYGGCLHIIYVCVLPPRDHFVTCLMGFGGLRSAIIQDLIADFFLLFYYFCFYIFIFYCNYVGSGSSI